MKRTVGMMLWVAILTVPALAALVEPARAETWHYLFRGLNASGYWYQSNGCVSTVAWVSPLEWVSKDGPGRPAEEERVFVGIWQFDYCAWRPIHDIWAYASLGPNEFTGDKQLQSAALVTSVPGWDYSTSSPVQISLNLAWIGTGDVDRSIGHWHWWAPQYSFSTNSRYNGEFRYAEVAGTVSVGTTNYATGHALGYMSYTQSGTLAISK